MNSRLGAQYTVELLFDTLDKPVEYRVDHAAVERAITHCLMHLQNSGVLATTVVPTAKVTVGAVRYETDYHVVGRLLREEEG